LNRLGILGGTLDPIHCGHLAAAAAARDAFDLSRVLVLPSRIPPHRPSLDSKRVMTSCARRDRPTRPIHWNGSTRRA
jgi:nicotinate-nucleotide adenylyltransferase